MPEPSPHRTSPLGFTLLIFLLMAFAFFAGLQATYHYPQFIIPAFRLLSIARAVVIFLPQLIYVPPPSASYLSAMNTNTFEVHEYQANLPGTIMFALRSREDDWKYFDSRIVEVNRKGETIWEYKIKDHEPGFIISTDVRRLSNGNVVFPVAKPFGRFIYHYFDESPKAPKDILPNWMSAVIEINRQGETVNKILTPVSHHAEILPNGNLLTVSSFQDIVREIDPSGKLVWQWDAAEHIRPYSSENFAHYLPRTVQNPYTWRWDANDWTHVNSAQRLSNGNTLISLRNFDLVIEVNSQGDTVWSFGPLVLKHQHCAWLLENGHLLVTDNGNARVIEVDRATQQIVWEYKDGLNMPVQACAYRLPYGNTLITDSYNYRILEVTPQKEKAWELIVKTPVDGLYRAWWSP
jgi:hypothetical protein